MADLNPLQNICSRFFENRKKILVMDEEPSIRKLLERQLGRLNYNVEICADGAAAISLYKKAMESGTPFDAVILDMTNSCGMGGIEAIKVLLKIDANVKGIISTGFSTDPVTYNFTEYGFCGALIKPYSMAELKKTLSDIIH